MFKTDNHLVQAKILQNTPVEHSAILLTCTKLSLVFKAFDSSIFEWPLKDRFHCIYVHRMFTDHKVVQNSHVLTVKPV